MLAAFPAQDRSSAGLRSETPALAPGGSHLAFAGGGSGDSGEIGLRREGGRHQADGATRGVILEWPGPVHTFKSVNMNLRTPSQPTLWRTCRVLANRQRLRIFECLLREPGLSVTSVADRLNLSVALTSLYLRALEARGLLTVRRAGRRVHYRVSGTEAAPAIRPLVLALRQVFEARGTQAVPSVFKLATAFTHPRRLELFKAVSTGARTFAHLSGRTRISRLALGRHVAKLESRGFLRRAKEELTVISPRDRVAEALAAMVLGSDTSPADVHTFKSVNSQP